MPSLNALGEFKSSFNNIGDEKNRLVTAGLPFDDLALPETEAASLENSLPDAGKAGDSAANAAETSSSAENPPEPVTAPPEDVSSSPGGGAADFGFGDLLGVDPANLSSPPTDETEGDDLLSGSPDLDEDLDLGEGIPESTFDLGSEEFDIGAGESAGPDISGEAADAGLDLGSEFDPNAGLPDFDIDGDESAGEDLGLSIETTDGLDLGNEKFDLGDDIPEFDTGAEDTGETPDLGLTGDGLPEISDEDFDLGDGLPDFDIGTEEAGETPDPGLSGDGLPEISDEDFDLGDGLPEFDTGAEGAGEMPDFGLPETGLPETTGEELDLGGDAEIPAGDGFDAFNVGGEESAGFGGKAAPAEGKDPGDMDFTLPGIDDLIGKSEKETAAKPAVKAKQKTRAKTKKEDAADVEEILLSDEDMDNLRKTLSAYPLNLRIACEELIAEQVLAPEQLSKLIRLLVEGAPAKETAALASKILDRKIIIPKGFEKSTGEALEAEQASFAYIFVHNFLPILRLFSIIAVLGLCVFYLGYKFIYNPLKAESIYERGYERIFAGEYQRANTLFNEAFSIKRKKGWFYRYAEAFRDERRFMLAEEKYEDLLRHYPRDKKGVLDYSGLETNYLMNYEKAERILLHELLDYAPNDREGLIALGDNYLAWADSNPSRYRDKYEDARFAYARLLDNYGWQAPVVERMMRYFIRTDNLKEVLPLKYWFDSNPKSQLSVPALSELGGYLLDKQLEIKRGVPDEYVESIQGVRDMLLQAVRLDPRQPEPHYHLARYYGNLGNSYEERLTLENAIRAFDNAKEESVKRRIYRIDTHRRYANVLVNNREFFPAEEQLVRGINLYEEFLSRNLISPSPQQGRLYADLGDLEYFVKSGSMETALNHYHRSERDGWSPPEIQYRMGAAYYQLEDWKNSLEYLFRASAELPLNRRMLFAIGNAAYKRADYFAAQGYYNRLLDILENQRSRLTVLLPNDRPDFLDVGERLMMARNNAGVAHEALAKQTGNLGYRSRAMVFYAESARAWDAITRNPGSMVRLRPSGDLNAPGVNLGYLNANNALRPSGSYEPEIFIRIDKDVLEPSRWEELAPVSALDIQ